MTARSRPFREDGRELSLMLGLGSLASRIVVDAASAVPYPDGLAPTEACLIGCCRGDRDRLGPRDGARSRRRHASRWSAAAPSVCAPSRAPASRAPPRSTRSTSTLLAPRPHCRFGATNAGPGEGLDAVFDVVGTPRHLRRRNRDARFGRHLRARRGAEAGARRLRSATVLRPAAARSRLARGRPPAGRGLPASRNAQRSPARSTSKDWCRSRSRSTISRAPSPTCEQVASFARS